MLIKSEEGLKLHAYEDSDHRWRIGYATPSYRGEVITKPIAEKRLREYLQKEVWRYIPENLNKNQYTVYASLIYNLGRVGARKLLIVEELDCKKILMYDKVRNKKHSVISSRRKREYELCVS